MGLSSGRWGPGWTRFATFEQAGVEHLIAYNGDTGQVHIDRVNEGGSFTSNVWTGSWAGGWNVVTTFEVGNERLLLVYDQGSGSVRIDRINPGGVGSTNTAIARWAVWTSIESVGLNTSQRDHVIVYNSPTGVCRLDRVRSDGTVNVWEEKWPPGFDTIMPYRLDATSWYVLAYDRDSGRMETRMLAVNGSATILSEAWSPGWSHFVAVPTHPGFPRTDSAFIAYNAVTGDVHLDHMWESSWSIERTDRWDPGWTHLVAPHLGRVILGNTGLFTYNMLDGSIRTNLVMPGP